MNYDELARRVYEIVADIPAGHVLTYGTLAVLAGVPSNARQVGKIMSNAPRDLSSHRVVNHAGRTVPGWTEQRSCLEAEGVAFKENGCADLKRHLWRPI
ncbi:MAG: MGMT family protein [Defluviitaleaceae bacterium]|nr:MGMT family protein [Defluviitaleaceae bacterium]MCL2836786.1 MGMT family protein [Defluviitaleaceae bacterium]